MRIASASAPNELVDVGLELGVDLDFRLRELGASGFLRERVDHLDELLDRVVRGLERGDRFVFGHLVGARFDHHDAVLGAGDDEVELALLALREASG